MSLHRDVVVLLDIRRIEIGMTQAELARRIGWTPKHVNRIMQGHAEPSLAALDFIAHVLDVELTATAKVRGEWGTLMTPGER